MKKGTIITLVVSILVFLGIGFFTIVLVTPQSDPIIYNKVEYKPLARNEYVFIPSKDITAEGVEQNYEVDREYLNVLEKNQGYKPRKNNNPFSSGNAAPSVPPSNKEDGKVQEGSQTTDSPVNNPSSPNAENNAPVNTGK